jgi:hypothetical protein
MRIRSFNALVLLAILFMASLLMVMLPVQGGYSVPVQNCPNVKPKIEIIDESGWQFPGKSIETLESTSFKEYVTTITQHISAKICEIASSKDKENSPPEVELFFVYRPLRKSPQSPTTSFSLQFPKVPDSRFLDSPWVKISINRSPKLVVRAIFLLNDRQFLLDQALLSGEIISSQDSMLPLNPRTLNKYFTDYADTIIRKQSQEAEVTALTELARRLPPEIFWLMRKSDPGRTTRHGYPMMPGRRRLWFSENFYYSLPGIYSLIISNNTMPTKTLIDQFFASSQTELNYQSVLDLKGVFNIEPMLIQPK